MSKKGRCPHCEKPIGLQQAIFANGNLWHVEHFICTLCSVAIGANEGFHRLDTKRQACDRCFEEHFAPKCYKCHKGISSNLVVALEANWHRDCLRCCKCDRTLKKHLHQDSFGKPLDHDCFWDSSSSTRLLAKLKRSTYEEKEEVFRATIYCT
ncbi:hypothetical protein L596_023960 [Steinernema carpocapsae]|uniref:LIM zinc-binding domain-containing protein n=1 Tax=Steinernema carpocapsae TaxID=34508 RepID=A0A4U5MF87_STECR|nr:hypothetical protein L596_023960 [Steinernema carpocapsae]